MDHRGVYDILLVERCVPKGDGENSEIAEEAMQTLISP
jgi:hypothetical protein